MKWRCDSCGFEQPRHPATRPEEMPICRQRQSHNGKPFQPAVTKGFYDPNRSWVPEGSCGGTPQPIDDFRFQVGQVVTVRAWWTNPEGQPIKCKVEEHCPNSIPFQHKPLGYMVRPISHPGAHGRYVREDTINV